VRTTMACWGTATCAPVSPSSALLRLGKEAVTEQVSVTEEVRTEQIETDGICDPTGRQ